MTACFYNENAVHSFVLVHSNSAYRRDTAKNFYCFDRLLSLEEIVRETGIISTLQRWVIIERGSIPCFGYLLNK